jgi:hypothetical protein
MQASFSLRFVDSEGVTPGNLVLTTMDQQLSYGFSVTWEEDGETALLMLEGPCAGELNSINGGELVYGGSLTLNPSKKSRDWSYTHSKDMPICVATNGRAVWFVFTLVDVVWAADIVTGRVTKGVPRLARLVRTWDIRAEGDEQPFITSV